jgi:PAS domain S-box-containing protein
LSVPTESVFRLDASHLALALHGADFGFWEHDLVRDEIHWYNNWCAMLDIDPCLGPGHFGRWTARIHPDDKPTEATYRSLTGPGSVYQAEYRMRTGSGAWRWIMCRGRATHFDDQRRPLRVTGIAIDTDARKRAELAVLESEERLDAAVGGTEIGLWESYEDGSFRWLNDWHILSDIRFPPGLNRTEHWRDRIHPEDLGRYVTGAHKLYSGLDDHAVVEYRFRINHGHWRWLHERSKITARHPDGTLKTMVGVCFDVSARKEMEAALRMARQRYQVAIDAAQLAVCEWSIPDDVVHGNVHWYRTRGYDLTEEQAAQRRETGFGGMHPHDLPLARQAWREHARSGKDVFEQEFRTRMRDGAYRWMLSRTQVIERDAVGNPLKVTGILLDIDSRRRAEQLLLTQAMIVKTIGEGIVLIDASGRIEFTNAAFDRMFGRECGHLAGTSIAALVGYGNLAADAIAIGRLLKRFESHGRRHQVTFQRPDGGLFTAELLLNSFEFNGEKKTLVALQDVSERKSLEREITQIAHRERQRLGSDLHDGLGQELTGIALLLHSLVTRRDAVDTTVARELHEIISLVNHAIHSTRSIAQGLSPIALQRGGLAAALRSLATWAKSTYGIDVHLSLGSHWERTLEEASATHLYLIAQEAIINAAKHGAAHSATIRLRVRRGALSFSIADDGVGILDPKPDQGGGMGLQIMKYRADMLGGALQIKRGRRGGTTVRCVCPETPLTQRVSR